MRDITYERPGKTRCNREAAGPVRIQIIHPRTLVSPRISHVFLLKQLFLIIPKPGHTLGTVLRRHFSQFKPLEMVLLLYWWREPGYTVIMGFTPGLVLSETDSRQ